MFRVKLTIHELITFIKTYNNITSIMSRIILRVALPLGYVMEN